MSHLEYKSGATSSESEVISLLAFKINIFCGLYLYIYSSQNTNND